MAQKSKPLLSLAMSEAAMRVKSTHLIKSCLKPEKKRENMEVKEIFYINLHLKNN